MHGNRNMFNNINTNSHDSDYDYDNINNKSYICIALNSYGSQLFTYKMHNFAQKNEYKCETYQRCSLYYAMSNAVK